MRKRLRVGCDWRTPVHSSKTDHDWLVLFNASLCFIFFCSLSLSLLHVFSSPQPYLYSFLQCNWGQCVTSRTISFQEFARVIRARHDVFSKILSSEAETERILAKVLPRSFTWAALCLASTFYKHPALSSLFFLPKLDCFLESFAHTWTVMFAHPIWKVVGFWVFIRPKSEVGTMKKPLLAALAAALAALAMEVKVFSQNWKCLKSRYEAPPVHVVKFFAVSLVSIFFFPHC